MKLRKYVMINEVLPVLFDGFNHSDLKAMGKNITSAGYFRFDENGKVVTCGESQTLHMIPSPDDAAVIQGFLDRAKWFEDEKGD